ncbi:MAG: anaerobic sulfatase maturase [Clostridia bacterium]
MTSASFLIKPASGRCNLACTYCFYRDEVEHRSVPDYGFMSEETAALLVDRAFESGASTYTFGFQGGEPTLAGLPFFRRFVSLVKERKRPGDRVDWTIQTNGVLIDEEWARFLKDEGFLVGLSLDGPKLLHDAVRIDRQGRGSHDRVLAGLAALQAADVPVNALCVVTDQVAANAAQVYQYLRRRGLHWMQFIPCLEPLDAAVGRQSWSLSPEAYARFLCTIFDLWHNDHLRGTPASIRWFDNLVGMAMGHPPENCGMAGRCSTYFTVEADGSVYPCDFYVTDEWRLGNIRDQSLSDMMSGVTARRFVSSSEPVDPACQGCFAYPLCRGGCRRDREPFAGELPGLNRYCKAYKEFFAYAGERLMGMVIELPYPDQALGDGLGIRK